MSHLASGATTMSATPDDTTVSRYVAALTALGVLLLVAGLVAATPSVAGLLPSEWLLLLALLVGFFLLQRRSLIQEWRGHRVTLALDEALLFTALVMLPAAFVVPLVFLAIGAVQLSARRRPLKVAFNVAAYTVAAGVGAGSFLVALSFGLPDLAAATLAVPAYAFSSNVLVAGVFALLEGKPVAAVFRERFLVASVFNVLLGIGLGIAILALWSFHPAALIVLIPLGYVAQRYAALNVRAEREILVRERLAELARDLTGRESVEDVAGRVVRTCVEVFHAGRVTLRLRPESGPERAWTQDGEGGPIVGALPVEAQLLGRRGAALGTLAVYPSQRTHETLTVMDAKLVGLVAAQTGGALESASSNRALVDLMRRHRQFVEHVPAGVAYLDAHGRLLHANPVLAASLGAPPTTGASAFDLGPVRAHAPLRDALRDLLLGKRFDDLEAPWAEDRWMSVSGVPLQEGDAPGAVLLLRDVTHRRQAEESLRTQSLTRPLVRRIVQGLTAGENLSPFHVAEAGRDLAREVRGGAIEDYALAYRAMGMGDLQFEREENGTYVFSGDDLLERRGNSTQPTCHLARGFVEGAVGALHGTAALGSETRCQSMGHARCAFVVKPRLPR